MSSEIRPKWMSVCRQLNEYLTIIRNLKKQRNEYADPGIIKIFDELISKIDNMLTEYLARIKETLKETKGE